LSSGDERTWSCTKVEADVSELLEEPLSLEAKLVDEPATLTPQRKRRRRRILRPERVVRSHLMHRRSQPVGRVEKLRRELLGAIGPDFSGDVVLHCAHGSVLKYEVHQVLRPDGGPVAVEPEAPSAGASHD
jgi:hypothetical protein